jgi:hypothetical protein
MYFNTMTHVGQYSLDDGADLLVIDPREYVSVGDSLSRACCSKDSLDFSYSELAAAQLFLIFEVSFETNANGAFVIITGYRIEDLDDAIRFLRPFDRVDYPEIEDAFPGMQNVSADDMIKFQSFPFGLDLSLV